MCDIQNTEVCNRAGFKIIPVENAVGMVLAHDITEIRRDEFKGRAFKKGHIVKEEDICHLRRLGKEHLFVLNIGDDELHEDDAAYLIANALIGEGVRMEGEPKEGKINLIAVRDGLLRIDADTLTRFNMVGDVMCATFHNNTVVKKGQIVAGTRAIPLVVKRDIVDKAVAIAHEVKGEGARGKSYEMQDAGYTVQDKDYHVSGIVHHASGVSGATGIIEVREIRKPKTGIVITGNEVYYGRIKDAFAPIITKKIEEFNGDIIGIYYAPDDEGFIEARLRELIEAGADLLISTGGMSVDPDDVTRFAIRRLGATDITYGSAVIPGSMFLVAYLEKPEARGQKSELNTELRTTNPELIPVLGIPACGMYHKTTIFDLILPRVLAGEIIGRKELADMGHGGLCLNCKECRYPVCPFGK